MQKTTYILLLFLIGTSSLKSQKVEIDSSIDTIQWEINKNWILLDSTEMIKKSFSISEIIDENQPDNNLDFCDCKFNNDTLTIWISDISEGGLGILLKIHQDTYDGFIRHYSDIPEFDDEAMGQYHIDYKSTESQITLKQLIDLTSNTVIGYLDINSPKIESFDEKKHRFYGRFQCKIY